MTELFAEYLHEATQAVQIHLMHKHSKVPTKGSPQAAGYDLYASQFLVLFPNETGVVGCGFRMRMPEDMCAMVCSRSGLAAKKGIFVSNAPGILDADYRGEIKVILHNLSRSPFSVKPGDRIAQMVFHKVERTSLNIVDTFVSDDTDRGTGGLGSTGGTS